MPTKEKNDWAQSQLPARSHREALASLILAQELSPQAGPGRTKKGNYPTSSLFSLVFPPTHLCNLIHSDRTDLRHFSCAEWRSVSFSVKGQTGTFQALQAAYCPP